MKYAGFILVLLGGSISAQLLRGPVEGYIFDPPTKSLRALVGSLGSAHLGAALVRGLDYASVAPRQSYAIGFRDGQGLLMSALGSSTSATPITGLFAVPEGMEWSSDGSVAVLYSRGEAWIKLLTGLPAAPNVGARLNLSNLGGMLSAVAVSQHGEYIVIALGGSTPGVYELAGAQSLLPFPVLSEAKALTFSNDGGTLYAIQSTTHRLVAVNMEARTAEAWTLDSLQDPVALAAAAQRVFVAGGKDRLLLALDVENHRTPAEIPLGFEPTTIEPLGAGSFLLRPRETDEDPIWSFNSFPEPSVYFVPALPSPLQSDRVRGVR